MFSVIIPVYNKCSYLEKAFSSVVSQTYRNFELILINDGSTDGSPGLVQQLISGYESQFPAKTFVLLHQTNQGVSVARNRGIAVASNPYIAFLDADDWWAPDYLSQMEKLISAFPGAGIYCSSYFKVKNSHFYRADIGVGSDFNKGMISYFQVYAATLWMPVWTGATIVKKTIVEEFEGFHPQLKIGEDFYLWSQIAARYPVVLLNLPLAFYNQDVEVENRAVGSRLYEINEHMLFAAYPDALRYNSDFNFLVEKLALYGLIPYYAAGKHVESISKILKSVHWNRHPLHYFIYYRILSPFLLRTWLLIKKKGAMLKKIITI